VDTTGSITLAAGSILDVSSGGRVLPSGHLQTSGGVPVGNGGSVSLTVYNGPGYGAWGGIVAPRPPLPDNQPTGANIVMNGTIRSLGFGRGGTLSLHAAGIVIGDDPTQAKPGDLYLPSSFFLGQGFSSYNLGALYDAVIEAGATVRF